MHVPRGKWAVFCLDSKVSGITYKPQAICVDQLFRCFGSSLATTEWRSLWFMILRSWFQTYEPLTAMDQRSGPSEQGLARQGAGLQCIQVIQEVVQDLIHELLGQALPPSAGKLLGDFVDPLSYIARCESDPQVGSKSYGGVSVGGVMGVRA